jgi:hypothetical protein
MSPFKQALGLHLWLSILQAVALLLFTRGFLLTRVELPFTSHCDDLPIRCACSLFWRLAYGDKVRRWLKGFESRWLRGLSPLRQLQEPILPLLGLTEALSIVPEQPAMHIATAWSAGQNRPSPSSSFWWWMRCAGTSWLRTVSQLPPE